MLNEPLSPIDARTLCRGIIKRGLVFFTRHAADQMARRKISQADCVNVLRGGWPEPGEIDGVRWTYRVGTRKMYVVVTFRSDSELTVITAWRNNT